MKTYKVRYIKTKNGKRVGSYTNIQANSQKEAVAKFLKQKGQGTGWKVTEKKKRRATRKPKPKKWTPYNLLM